MSKLPQLSVSLFGGFRLLVDEQPHTAISQPQQQSLLAYLMLHTRTPQLRRQVAFYGSTPAYLPTLACHGWQGVHEELNRLSKQGRWDEMTNLVGDLLYRVLDPRMELHT